MDVVDYLRSGALIVGFLSTAFAGRETWLLADLIVTFSFGLAFYFFPGAILTYQTEGKLDPIHMYLSQLFGAMLISTAVTWYLSKNSRNSGVQASLMLSRALSAAILLQAMILDHMKASADQQKWSKQHLSFGVLGCALWLVGNLIQLLRSPTFNVGSVSLGDRSSHHVIIDILILLPGALSYYAFPDFGLSHVVMQGFEPDGIHGHLMRALGATLFGTCLHGLNSLSFSDDHDKRAHFAGRLTVYALTYPAIALYQWKYSFLARNTLIIAVLISLIPSGNALCAYFRHTKIFSLGHLKRK